MKYPESFQDEELHKKWIELKKIRDICNISIEAKRASKEIGSSLEASLVINLNKTLFEISKNVDFSEICITSSASVHQSNTDKTIIETVKAEGSKCPVCWKINKVRCERHSD
jgi:isoleucyl-tRNA synthetase